MISIDRLEEMAIEELETKLNNWKEQVELQSNFIDSLLKVTNNSEWLNKTILDDEASEIIEKIELDYAQHDQLKAENEELKKQLTILDDEDVVVEITVKQFEEYKKLSKTLTEIKEIAKNGCYDDCGMPLDELSIILQKISECEVE